MMHQAGCGYKDLMDVAGVKQKETLDRKLKPHHQELGGVYKGLFAKVF